MARYMRTYGKSTLRPPVVVATTGALRGLDVTSSPSTPAARRRPTYWLRRPPIIRPAISQIGPPVSLAPSRRGRAPLSALQPPTVLAVPFVARPVEPQLVRVPPRRQTNWLRRPTVIFPALVQIGPPVVLAPKPRAGRPRTLLRPPLAVVAVVPVIGRPVDTQLARVPPRRTLAALRGPVIVDPFGFVQIGPPAYVTYSRRGIAKSELRPPITVGAPTTPAPPLRVNRARTPPRRQQTFLRPPVVIFPAPLGNGPGVNLVQSRRGKTVSRLSPPAAVTPSGAPPLLAATLAYSSRGRPTSQISAPSSVGDGIAFFGPSTRPASISHRRQSVAWKLSEPVVVAAAVVLAAPLRIVLARLPFPRKARAELAPPVAVAVPAFHGPGTRLASLASYRRPVRHALAPPTVVATAALATPTQVTLAPSQRRIGLAGLSAPAVIGGSIVNFGPRVRLVTPQNSRAPVESNLYAPVVVTPVPPVAIQIRPVLVRSHRGSTISALSGPAVVGATVFHGPGIRLAGPVNTRALVRHRLAAPVLVVSVAPVPTLALTFAPQPKPQTSARLNPPAVIRGGISFRGPGLRLAAPRSTRPPVTATLAAPVTVGNIVAFHGPGVKLVAPLNARQPVRKRLAAPTVVVGVAPARPLQLRLAPSTRGKPTPVLSPPAVVGPTIAFHGPGVKLTAPANSRRPVRHTLAPPAVVTPLAFAFHGPGVRLASISNSRRPVAHRLVAPTVIRTGYTFRGPGVKLVAPINSRASVGHRLRPPTVVAPFVRAFYGPGVRVASISNVRRPVAHKIAPPTVVRTIFVFHGPGVRLVAPSDRRQPVTHRLNPPTVLATLYVFHGPGVRLAGPIDSRQPVPHRLAAPTVIAPPVAFGGPSVRLAPQTRGLPKSRLAAPSVVGNGKAFHGPRVKLAPPIDARQKVRYRLAPPAIVTDTAVAVTKLRATIVRGRAGSARPQLHAPTVIGPSIVNFGPRVLVVRPTDIPERRRPIYRLEPPTAVQPLTLIFFGPNVHRAYSLRGRPLSSLNPPAIVGAGITFAAVTVQLAYSLRGRPQTTLNPPTVIGQAPLRAIRVTLARIKPVRTRTVLRAPAVVRFPPFRPLDTTLVRIRPARVHPILRAPQIPLPTLAQATLTVTLAPSRRPTRFYRLRPPARVGGGIVFRAVQTHLARIVHPPVNRMLGAPTVIILISNCHGYVTDHAPGGGHIEDSSHCADGQIEDHTDAGGMIQDTAPDGGIAGDHPQAGGHIVDKGG